MARTRHRTGHVVRRLPAEERRHRFRLPDRDHHFSTVVADCLLGQAVACVANAALQWAQRLAVDCYHLIDLIVRALIHLF